MKLKLDENGNAVVQDGKPVYVHEDGKEVPFDAPAAMAKIQELNEEAKKHRLRARELNEKLQMFLDAVGDETDPGEWLEKAVKAIETVQNLDQKKLVDAGQVEALKKNLSEAYEKKLAEMQEVVKAKENQIYRLTISSAFASSPFIAEKTTLPPDIAETYFGRHFKVEEGENGEVRIVGYINGNPILSREKPGEPAPFEEAIQVIVENYPMKDRILRGTPGGSGGSGNQGGAVPGGITLADLRTPAEKAEFIAKHGREAFQKLVDQAVAGKQQQ